MNTPRSYNTMDIEAQQRQRKQEEECCQKIKVCVGWSIVFGILCYAIILLVTISFYGVQTEKEGTILYLEPLDDINWSGSLSE
tara:strand:- start:152 stop:400 length:249 start_codon:yes stop_codon:yes gene_type:complete